MATVVKEYLTTAEDWRPSAAATVKQSLTDQNNGNRRIAEARQADAEDIAELAWIEKQLEQKKDKR